MSKRYWEKPITLRLTPYQRKVLSEIVDGSADAGACKDGLSKAESNALLSIHMRLIGATDAQKKIDELFEPEAQSLPREAELRDDEAPPTKYWREMYYDLLKHADTLLAREAELRRALEPCPFCGGEAGYYASGEAVFKANWIGHVCHCKNCQARIITSAGMDAAVQMWNARAITTPALNEGERNLIGDMREVLEQAVGFEPQLDVQIKAILKREVATYAGTNTNLRNDLVLMGMAKDAALAQVEEVKTRCSQVADAVKDDADQRAIGLKFEDLHEMRVRSDTAREIGETIRALELSSTERTAVCEICGKCEGRHHKEFDGFVCEECQSQWTERANG